MATTNGPVRIRATSAAGAVSSLLVLVAGCLVAMAAPVAATTGQFSQPLPVLTDSTGAYAENNDEFVIGSPTEPAAHYPSTVEVVAPAAATINRVDVQVAITHPLADELDLMLVSPNGTAVMLMSDALGDAPVDTQLIFDSNGQTMPDAGPPNLMNLPTDWDTTQGDSDGFSAPAPTSAVASFDPLIGEPVHGTWSLFVVDDTEGANGDAVGFVHHWEIDLSYDPVPPDPSTLTVSGLPTNTTDVDLTLRDVNVNSLSRHEFVLESPAGDRAIVLSDAGGDDPLTDIDLVLDDEASSPIGSDTAPTSGSYQPWDYDDVGDELLPASLAKDLDDSPYGSSLSVFDGTDPNGTWKLYVASESCCAGFAVAGGWSLSITTSDPAAPPQVATPVITAPANGSRHAHAAVTLNGTATAGSAITVAEGGTSVLTLAPGGTWQVTAADLGDGSHTFTVTASLSGSVSPPASVTIIVDTQAPTITKATPRHRARGVPTTVSPKVRFSEALAVSSVTKQTVRLVRASAGRPGKAARATLTYRSATNTAVVNPRRALAPHTRYRLTVTTGIRDLAGNPPVTTRTWTFTTR